MYVGNIQQKVKMLKYLKNYQNLVMFLYKNLLLDKIHHVEQLYALLYLLRLELNLLMLEFLNLLCMQLGNNWELLIHFIIELFF